MKFCKKCDTETERNKRGECKICMRASKALYVKNNAEKVKASKALYIKNNAEKVRASKARWLKNHPEEYKKIAAEYRAANRGKCNEMTAAWGRENAEWIRIRKSARRIANPEWARNVVRNRRAKRRGNSGVLSKGISEKLFAAQKGICPCCFQPLGDNYHLDHIMPLALGGTNTDDNVQLLRAKCNWEKGAKHPDDFMRSRGFLIYPKLDKYLQPCN